MNLDKSTIKKAFRQKSLLVHPDKNPSPEADSAFKLAQSAYYCLIDEKCRAVYDQRLDDEEALIAVRRKELKENVVRFTANAMNQLYYHVSIGANHIYQFGVDLWNFVGEWEPEIFGIERIPVGKAVLSLLLLFKGQFLLKVHALSYIVMRVNYEIARAQGLL
jgi:hypothetical protein